MRIMLDIPISLYEIEELFSASYHCEESILVQAVSTDSRECEAGDLFFSLAKTVDQRLQHCLEAERRGAYTVSEGYGFITVENSESALLKFASFYKSKLPRLIKTVAITGSVGKSTATRFTSSLISLSYKVSSTIGNFNNRIGLSLSILNATKDTEVLVLEMGMNHSGEIYEIARAICPEICVITNIGKAHIGNLGSRKAIRDAKCEIITRYTEAVVCPADEPLLRNVPHRLTVSSDVIKADVCLIYKDGSYCIETRDLLIDGIELKVIGKHNKHNALIAATVGLLLYMPMEKIRLGLSMLGDGFADGRLRRIGDITFIDDSYNSSPDAVSAMLELIKGFPPIRVAILGDMLELGESAKTLHYEVGKSAAFLDRLYAVGDFSDYTVLGAIDGGMEPIKAKSVHRLEPEQLAKEVCEGLTGGTVLIKGSHATGISETMRYIRERMEK